ncbi:metal dependent hydrolase [Gottschalkia purinilytica]|uniref:Metal dependent hydrolase n=1 Tax=Gottschalkia purinilytica TaxID=1503 RepID=A0A0L0WC79_GOTPU|nr:MBL fold metallo-hydrolase [Gottschalkia purinilytica]KNF09071.1 metal dependent hydrolase [Gottschalkia purinilytica]
MKLKVVVDNNTYIDQYYYGEPAVCYYIEDDDAKILLDVGYSDLFIKNSVAFGIDLSRVNIIAISHGHNDHTGGLAYYFSNKIKKDVTVIAHPNAFDEKSLGEMKISSPIGKDSLAQNCNLKLSAKPVRISKNITFLGQIPQLNDFENRSPIGTTSLNSKTYDDYVMDDSALVYQGKDGLHIITGCSHSGICNIIEYAKQVCNDDKVISIIGGFHLFQQSERLDETIAYLKKNRIKELYPCHCTSFSVRAEIHKFIPIKEVGVGLELHW